MVGRICLYVALVALGAVLGWRWDARAAGERFEHEGRVVEHLKRTPLEAEARAYRDDKRSDSEGSSCPAYGASRLDERTSSGGVVRLSVEKTNPTYTLVYCRNGYVPRVDPQENDRDKSPLQPYLAELWPAEMSKEDLDGYDDEVAAVVFTFLNDASYLQKVSGERFAFVLSALATKFDPRSEEKAAVIRNVGPLASRWGGEKR